MKLQVNPSTGWHVTGQKRKGGWKKSRGGGKKNRVGGTNETRKEEVFDRDMVARLFPEPAVELIRLEA